MGIGLRFGSKIVMSLSRYGLSFLPFSCKQNYSSSHSKCHSILNADQEAITYADWVV